MAGMSESSGLRGTPRVLGVAVLALAGLAGAHFAAPSWLRAELLLPGLFGLVSVLSLVAGAAKLEDAVESKEGPRALRRAAGLLVGSLLGIAALGAASLELLVSSPSHARWGWAHALPLVAGVLLVFAQRTRLIGSAALALGRPALVLSSLGLLGLVGARVLVVPQGRAPVAEASLAPAAPVLAAKPELEPVLAPAVEVKPAVSAGEPVSALPSASAAPLLPAPPSSLGSPGSADLQIEALVTKGMLEADVRGGVMRRFALLEACVGAEASRPAGSLTLKVGIDEAGSVAYSRVVEAEGAGELAGSSLAKCLLPVFYRMGFAAPRVGAASFSITLRVGRAP